MDYVAARSQLPDVVEQGAADQCLRRSGVDAQYPAGDLDTVSSFCRGQLHEQQVLTGPQVAGRPGVVGLRQRR